VSTRDGRADTGGVAAEHKRVVEPVNVRAYVCRANLNVI
jgi:hypothetical protein